ncbi:hypothetical protein V1525DRAFT_390442 [Lipomyces kononenkoae]|uniref:Uncharacterized protein n=1 Tax=Lipomyces kononenkoae TaxID=34357 RepID=A0ACC3SVL2_LIPKO
MARPTKKSIQRSINGRKNFMKRLDKVNQITLAGGEECDGEGSDGEDEEQLQLVEIRKYPLISPK